MKRILGLLTFVALVSCKDSKNEQITKLLNRKKEITDSMPIYKYDSEKFLNKTVDESDSALKAKYKDSFSVNEIRRLSLKDELKNIDFSIDSLQKMK